VIKRVGGGGRKGGIGRRIRWRRREWRGCRGGRGWKIRKGGRGKREKREKRGRRGEGMWGEGRRKKVRGGESRGG